MKAIHRETELCDQASSKSSFVLGLRMPEGMMARMPLKHAFESLTPLGFGQTLQDQCSVPLVRMFHVLQKYDRWQLGRLVMKIELLCVFSQTKDCVCTSVAKSACKASQAQCKEQHLNTQWHPCGFTESCSIVMCYSQHSFLYHFHILLWKSESFSIRLLICSGVLHILNV